MRRLLLLLPFIGLLWLPFYNKAEPATLGISVFLLVPVHLGVRHIHPDLDRLSG